MLLLLLLLQHLLVPHLLLLLDAVVVVSRADIVRACVLLLMCPRCFLSFQGTVFVSLLDLASGKLWPSSVVATGAWRSNNVTGAGSIGGDGRDGSADGSCSLCYVPGIDACASDYYYVVVCPCARTHALAKVTAHHKYIPQSRLLPIIIILALAQATL